MKMTNNIEKKESEIYVQELWRAFEKTGAISAYILYNIARRREGKKEKRIKARKEKAL